MISEQPGQRCGPTQARTLKTSSTLPSAWLLAVLLAFGGYTRASAQVSDEPRYRELVEQALGEFKHKHWPEARVLFARAHELHPNARSARGLGVVSFEMREYVAAITYLEAALNETRQPLNETQRTEAVTLIARSRAYVGMYTPVVTPPNAHVLLDGAEPVRDAEGTLLVPFGEHTVTANAPGYLDFSRRLNVQGAERSELTVSLSVVPEPVVAPVAAEPLPVRVAPQVAAVAAPLSAPVERPHTVRSGGLKYTWVALGAGAVFGGLAAGAWYLGDHELKRLDNRCRTRAEGDNPCQPGNVRTSSLTRYERLTDAGIGLAAAAVLTSAVLVIAEWPRERRVGVAVGPQSVMLRGAF